MQKIVKFQSFIHNFGIIKSLLFPQTFNQVVQNWIRLNLDYDVILISKVLL